MLIRRRNGKRVLLRFKYGPHLIRQVVPLAELAAWLLARQDRTLDEGAKSRIGPRGPVTLAEFAERHYPDHAKLHMPKSWPGERSRVQILVRLLGSRPVHEIAVHDHGQIMRYVKERELSPASIFQLTTRLANMLKAARDQGFIRQDALLPRFPRVKVSNARDRMLNEREERLLFAHARDTRLRCVLVVALNTGMRRGELANLRWSDVDLDQGWLNLRDTKNSWPRQVPINSAARTALTDPELVVRDGPAFGVGAHWMSHQFEKLVKAAGIENLRFHDLRRTFISRALKLGTPEELVRRIVGHRTHSQIARYAVLSPKFMAEELERLVPPVLAANEA